MFRKLLAYSKVGALLFLALTINACDDKDDKDDPDDPQPSFTPKLVVQFQLSNGGDVIKLDESFLDENGQWFEPTLFKFYLSDITLNGTDGEIELSEIELVDFEPFDPDISNPQWSNVLTYEVDPDVYSSITFGLGVKPELNNSEPTEFDNEHPLSVFANTYWSWASLYRFVLVEGLASEDGEGGRRKNLVFHTGLDSLYRNDLSYSINAHVKSDENDTIRFTIDFGRIFDPIDGLDIRVDSNTHTTDSPEELDRAVRFTDEFIGAMKAE